MRTREAGAIESVYRSEGARLQRAVALYAGNRQIAEDAVAGRADRVEVLLAELERQVGPFALVKPSQRRCA